MTRGGAAAAALALTALGACDAANTVSLGDAYNDDRQSFLDMEDRLGARSPTTDANMPTGGTATYEGHAALIVDRDVGLDLSLVGDATVSADFGRGTLTGRATDFLGTEGGVSIAEYDGSLSLNGGRIGGFNDSDATARLAGTLSSDDHVLRLDAPVVGQFVGNPGIAGVRMAGADGSATLDGVRAPTVVGVVAER